MWDGLVILLFLSIVMGGASFLAGSLPLSITLSPRQLRLVTALGTGVLVGTALIVIIPEGVETLYSAGGSVHSHDKRGLSVVGRASVALAHIPDTFERDSIGLDTHLQTRISGAESLLHARADLVETGPDSVDIDVPSDAGSDPQDTNGPEPHVWIGVSLILGFILMYLIDTLPQTASPSPPRPFHVNLNHFSITNDSSEASTDDRFDAEHSSIPGATSIAGLRASSTTVGLVIHAAADGIALGASSASSSNLSFIIFIALMIHKAPAAFGLTSVLLKQGLSKRMARTHLIIFSLAAPVGALLTWIAVHLLGFSAGTSLDEASGSDFTTGVLLLFSGGTFLYVAVHTMQENGSSDHAQDVHGANGYASAPVQNPYAAHVPSPPKNQGPALTDTLVTVGGMLLPLLTQWGHGH